MESTSSKRNYCIAIDGSQFSDWAFDLVLEEFYQKGDKVTVVHITNSAKSSEIPFAFQPQTIISKYDAKLTGRLASCDFSIIKKEKDPKSVHALLDVNQIAVANNCSVLVLGFYGHKAVKNELTKGLSYVINNIRLPVIVVKENNKRKNKNSGVFTWMASIEEPNTRSVKAFQFALNYIDVTKDKVIGTHIKFYSDDIANDVKEYFEKACQGSNVTDYSFAILDRDRNSDIGGQLSNFVNYNDIDSIDFCVLGHNSAKYAKDKVSVSPLTTFIKTAKSNILFFS
jgi:hypothetical protein